MYVYIFSIKHQILIISEVTLVNGFPLGSALQSKMLVINLVYLCSNKKHSNN